MSFPALQQLPDFYSPLMLILGGAMGLAFVKGLKSIAARRADSEAYERWVQWSLARFESRKRLSWVLLVFGFLWALQLMVEQSWAN